MAHQPSDIGFFIDDYLTRVRYFGRLDRTEETLRDLHRHQVLNIPFENLDPITKRAVRLDPESLAHKLLLNQRGGYCYELNGLFLLVLQELGFSTRSICARTMIEDGVYGKRSHQLTLVDIGERSWIVDVGFGGNGLLEPLPLEPGYEMDQRVDQYRVMADEIYGFRLEHRVQDAWKTLYAFSQDPFLPADYAMMNYFNSTSPESLFTQMPVCVRTTPETRLILRGDKLKIRDANKTTVHLVQTPEHLQEILIRDFGINWPRDEPHFVLNSIS